MKESEFIRQNKEKWSEFEEDLTGRESSPDRISRLFIQVTDDLSYSRTHYKNRSVRVYLNGVAQLLFNDINKSTKGRIEGFRLFWTHELPELIYHSRKEFLVSFLVFALSMAIGIFSSIHDNDFARAILGDNYVSMTIKNIENNDPMAVYKEFNEIDMFLGITLNNLMVAFRTFIFGIVFAVGSVFILIYNGIMVGTFQFFFIERGIFWDSFLTIWQHGVIEISCIIIAGAAGITIGKGLLFPGTLSRSQSLRFSGMRGLKIMVGIAPLIIIAAFIEGFYTRYTDMPFVIRLATIMASVIFIVGYFILLPCIRHRQGLAQSRQENQTTVKSEPVSQKQIYSGDQLFGLTFNYLYHHLNSFFKIILLLSFFYGIGICLIPSLTRFAQKEAPLISGISDLFDYSREIILAVMNELILFCITFFSFFRVSAHIEGKDRGDNNIFDMFITKKAIPVFLMVTVLNGMFFIESSGITYLILIILPLATLITYISFIQKKSIFFSIQQSIKILQDSWGKFLFLYFKLLFIGFGAVLLINTPFIQTYLNIINWNLPLDENWSGYVSLFFSAFIQIFVLLSAFVLILVSNSFIYYTLHESYYAGWLIKKIEKLSFINNKQKP